MKKSILYLTSTNWWWAKQRPQFIAEGLSSFFKVTYVYPKTYRTRNITKGQNCINQNLEIKQIFRLPLDRLNLVRILNNKIFGIALYFLISKYDIIWITHPLIFGQLKKILPVNKHYVYDCMDNHLEFSSVRQNAKMKLAVLKYENELVSFVRTQFFSSEYLKTMVLSRYGIDRKYTIINNALSKEFINPLGSEKISVQYFNDFNSNLKIVYTGTISSWFDFDLIQESLNRFPEIVYLLAGPSEVEIPEDARIKYIGPIPHDKIKDILNFSDALVMPFRDEELIMSVDPVKVYEYISFNKPAIVLKYSGTDKFDKYVYRYKTSNEYFSLIKMLTEGKLLNKKTKEESYAFLSSNTWEARINEILIRLRSD